MAFDMSDLGNKGKDFIENHQDEIKQKIQERTGDANQQGSDQERQDMSRGREGMGDTGMQNAADDNDMNRDSDMGMQDKDRESTDIA